jgi:hypothetical protein
MAQQFESIDVNAKPKERASMNRIVCRLTSIVAIRPLFLTISFGLIVSARHPIPRQLSNLATAE